MTKQPEVVMLSLKGQSKFDAYLSAKHPLTGRSDDLSRRISRVDVEPTDDGFRVCVEVKARLEDWGTA